MNCIARVSFLAAAIAALLITAAVAGPDVAQNPVLQKARTLAQEQNFTAAIDVVTTGLAAGTVPDAFPANMFLGTAYYKTGNYEKALAAFQRTIALNSGSRMAYWFIGHIYESQALAASSGAEKKIAQRKALDAWQSFLATPADNGSLPVSHHDLGISVESSNEQARKHVDVLERELSHE